MPALVLMVAFSGPVARSLARPPEPVCRQPTVVDVMTRELRARWYYAWLDPVLIQETPTVDGELFHCGVCVKIGMYATGQVGDPPVARCEPHAFSVQTVRNGFVVRYLQ
jgi:hypothetical protein